MKLGSACSGIGCIDLGLERAGFEPAWQIEIDPTCRAVLERHWPTVTRYEDLTHAATFDLARVDLIVGGTPCQDLSVAGKGAGLDGERSSIFYDFIRLADSQPWAFVLWENVPGALSSNGGDDFAVCLEGFTGTRFEVPPDGWRGSGVATGPYRWAVWRVLDAQYFGVAQRRRRLFVVAGPRGRCGPEILLEPEGLPGDPPPSREAGPGAATLTAGRVGSGRRAEDDVNLTVGSLQTVGPGGGWRLGADEAAAGQIVNAITGSKGGADDNDAQGGRLVSAPYPISTALVGSNPYGDHDGRYSQLVTSTLASHGTGGGYRLDDREARGNQIVLQENGHEPMSGMPSDEDTRGADGDRQGTRRDSDGEALPVLRGPSVRTNSGFEGRPPGRVGGIRAREVSGLRAGVAHTLRGGGFDASEDGTGRGTPLVVDEVQITHPENRANPTLAGTGRPMVYQCQGSNVGPMGTLRQGNGNEAGGVPFVASPLTASMGKTVDTAGSGGSGTKNLVFDEFNQAEGAVSSTLCDAHGRTDLVTGARPRRLTPRECERLQGLPEIKKTATILVCNSFDPESKDALAALRCLSERNSALPAAAAESLRSAKRADPDSSTSPQGSVSLAALHVLIGCGRRGVEILSRTGRSWFVNGADQRNRPRLLVPSADFARFAALMLRTLESGIPDGRAASHLSKEPSGPPGHGRKLVAVSGREIEELASDAEMLTTLARDLLKSTTSAASPSSRSSGSFARTLCCCVGAAISGFIPEPTRNESSYAFEVTMSSEWTKYRADGSVIADGPRYRMIGNGAAVPIPEWIGRRIRNAA